VREDDWRLFSRLFAKSLASFTINFVSGVGLWNDFGEIPLDRCFFFFGLFVDVDVDADVDADAVSVRFRK